MANPTWRDHSLAREVCNCEQCRRIDAGEKIEVFLAFCEVATAIAQGLVDERERWATALEVKAAEAIDHCRPTAAGMAAAQIVRDTLNAAAAHIRAGTP